MVIDNLIKYPSSSSRFFIHFCWM